MGFVSQDKLVIKLFAGEYILCSVENNFRLPFGIITGHAKKEKAIRTLKRRRERETAKNQIRPLRINGLMESLFLLAETTSNATWKQWRP